MEHPTSWREDIGESLGGYEAIVISPVYAELARLASGTSRGARFAKLARRLADNGLLRLERTAGDRADDELISRALDDGAMVATVDSALIEQLRASKVGVIRLRGGRVHFDAPSA